MNDSARAAVQDEVLGVLASSLEIERSAFDPDLSLAEMGLDSIGVLETVYVLENHFGIAVAFNANDKSRPALTLLTSGELIAMVVDIIMARRGSTAYAPEAATAPAPFAAQSA